MSHSQPCISGSALTPLTSGPDRSLVHACRTFFDRFAAFEKTAADFDLAEGRSRTDTRTVELQVCVDSLLAEWRLIASKVVTMPARHAEGLRAKARVLDVLLTHSGESSIEVDLARSLIADLDQVGDLGPVENLASQIKARYGAGDAHNSRHAAPVNDACHDQQG